MQTLSELIVRSEDWLVERTIWYAKRYGYAAYTSTLTEAWRGSVCGLSQPLIKALADYAEAPQLPAGSNYAEDSISAVGIQVARRHRSRGVTLGLFLGLMKYYRQSYIDLLELGEFPAESISRYREFIDRFYDRVELGFCSEWASQSESTMLRAAAEQNRSLTNEKNKYLTIFESLKDPVVLLDTHGKIENANHAAAELFGGSSVPGAGYYSSDHLILLDGILPSLLGSDGEHLLTTTIGERSFEVKSQAMLDVSEKFAGTVLIFNDVTDYKQAVDLAEQANRTKSAFLAAVSHEIRTPVNGIIGIGALLRETQLDVQQKKYVNVISTSGEILAALIADILDYSKIEAGVLEVENIEFSVGGLIDEILTIMLPLASAKDLSLTAELAPACRITAVGDYGKLRQILLNLVGNAVKFTARGGVQVRVEPNPNGSLRFLVIDSGIGIAEGSQGRIFSAFVQADASVARRFGGTGLGLAICHKLVTALGGEIGVDSEAGRGSTFWFEVPMTEVAPASIAHTDRAEESIVPLTVLVVEDNEINRLVATGLLERLGHRVFTAESGGEALERLDNALRQPLANTPPGTRFDLVLMDINLPGISGLDTIRLLRKHRDSRIANIPVIVLSALVTSQDIENSLAAGADAFLGKPYRPAQLEASIRQVLRRDTAAVPPPRPAMHCLDPAPMISEPEVDEKILAGHMLELGAATTGQLVRLFVDSAQQTLTEVRVALNAGATDKVLRAVHRLKSSAATIGLVKLTRELAESERAAIDGTDQLSARVDQLAGSFTPAIAALQAAWARLQQLQVPPERP